MPSQSRFARQLPRKRGSQNVTFRLGLPRLRDCAAEALPAAETAEAEQGTATVARRAGEGNNKQCEGRFLRTSPRRGTLSFVTQKFFCFGAINNRRNDWLGIPFCCHIGWVCTRTNRRSQSLSAPYIISGYGATRVL